MTDPLAVEAFLHHCFLDRIHQTEMEIEREFYYFREPYGTFKGQIKPKADGRAVDSPKKRTNEFGLFAFLLFTANKPNSFVRFLGESTVRQSAYGFI